MDKLGDRDLVLLRRLSDVDYADVFGGPPMLSYSYEHRRSLASCRPQPSSRLVLASEKPAFGGLSDPTQRRHLGDDFFSDIFPGSDSLSSTQWNLDHSPFLSPLPPHFSHPQVKLAKGLDHPLFGSLLCYDADKRYRDVLGASTFPHSLIANQAAPDDLRNGNHAFYHQSLSSQSSHGNQSGRCAASLKGYEELAREHVIANRSQRASENDVKVEVQDQRQNYVEPFDTVGPRVKDCLPLKDEMHGNKVRGRVKEFIDIFKFEGSTKFKSIYVGGKRKSTAKSSLKSKIDVQVNNSTPKPDAEMKVAPRTIEVTLHVGSANVQTSFEDKIPSTYISSNVHITNSSLEKNNTLGPSSDSTEESIEKYHLEDLDGCLVEQLSQELTETQQMGFIQNQINVANAKIMEWSKGKEGNIRSLLSTLQYVLWTESGWKPIRLSDIIEGTSVKKAYQKALLCLHPDKLQQRSAAEHEKYIADKVFGILQESWNQFNSVSLF